MTFTSYNSPATIKSLNPLLSYLRDVLQKLFKIHTPSLRFSRKEEDPSFLHSSSWILSNCQFRGLGIISFVSLLGFLVCLFFFFKHSIQADSLTCSYPLLHLLLSTTCRVKNSFPATIVLCVCPQEHWMFGRISQTLMQLHLLHIFCLAVSQLKYHECCFTAHVKDKISSPHTPQWTSQHQQKWEVTRKHISERMTYKTVKTKQAAGDPAH